MRTASVLRPRSTSQQSNGPATAPIAFWWKRIRSAASSKPAHRDRLTQHDGAADDVAVPTGILGRAVGDDVGAQVERALQVCRGEGVVDDEQRPGVVRDRRERGDVGDAEQRVGRGLDPEHLGAAGTDGGADRVEVAHRCDGVLDAVGAGDLVDVAVGAAVGVGRDDEMVARHEQRPDHAVLPGEPARESEPVRAAVERGEALLQRGAGRVGRAGVLVAAAQAGRCRPACTWSTGRWAG